MTWISNEVRHTLTPVVPACCSYSAENRLHGALCSLGLYERFNILNAQVSDDNGSDFQGLCNRFSVGKVPNTCDSQLESYTL